MDPTQSATKVLGRYCHAKRRTLRQFDKYWKKLHRAGYEEVIFKFGVGIFPQYSESLAGFTAAVSVLKSKVNEEPALAIGLGNPGNKRPDVAVLVPAVELDDSYTSYWHSEIAWRDFKLGGVTLSKKEIELTLYVESGSLHLHIPVEEEYL